MNIPSDVLIYIFAFLEISDWFNTKLVCRQWRNVGNQVFNPFLLHSSFRVKNPEAIKFLLTKLDPGIRLCYPLNYAARKGYVENVKILLEDKRVSHSIMDNTPLRLAIENGHTEVVKILLQKQELCSHMAKAHVKRIDSCNFIHIAAYKGYSEIVKFLLSKININYDQILTLIYYAKEGRQEEIINILKQDPRYLNFYH